MGLRFIDGRWVRPYLFTEVDYQGNTHRSKRYEAELGFNFISSAMKVTIEAPSGERLVYTRKWSTDKHFELTEDTRRK